MKLQQLQVKQNLYIHLKQTSMISNSQDNTTQQSSYTQKIGFLTLQTSLKLQMSHLLQNLEKQFQPNKLFYLFDKQPFKLSFTRNFELEMISSVQYLKYVKECRQKTFEITQHYKYKQKVLESQHQYLQNGNLKVQMFQNMKPQNCQMFKLLFKIQFPNLMYLNLQKSKIFSIEGLLMMNLSQLKSFMINNNYLRNINCLGKTSWKSLEQLILQRNYIVQISNIYRGNFDKLIYYFLDCRNDLQESGGQIEYISKQAQKNDFSLLLNRIIQDYRFLIRMKIPAYYVEINPYNQKRLILDKYNNCLRKRQSRFKINQRDFHYMIYGNYGRSWFNGQMQFY